MNDERRDEREEQSKGQDSLERQLTEAAERMKYATSWDSAKEALEIATNAIRSETAKVAERDKRTIKQLHDAADELFCAYLKEFEAIDDKAEAVCLGAMAMRTHYDNLFQKLADLRQQLAEKDKQLHCMELRAKSAEAIAGVSGVDIARPMASVRTCDCCEHSGATVQYHDAAGYLCDKCAPKVMAARESVRQHLQREAELEEQLAEARAENERVAKEVRDTDRVVVKLGGQLAAQAAGLATLRMEAKVHRDEAESDALQIRTLLKDNAKLRERLAAAELLLSAGSQERTLSGNHGPVHICWTPDGWKAIYGAHQRIDRCGSAIEATVKAMAAGWIPPSTKGDSP